MFRGTKHPRDKTSSVTKHPKGQNVLGKNVLWTKCPAGLNILRDKMSREKTSFYNIYKGNMFYVIIILSLSGRLAKVSPIELNISALAPLII
jgi:hypothetical protein